MSDILNATDPDPAEDVSPQGAFDVAAKRTQRSVFRPESTNPAKALPVVSDDAGYDALSPGTRFKDSEGKPFLKPYVVLADEDFTRVPEGAEFVDSQGQRFKKPVAGPVNTAAQYFYEIAPNPDVKRKVLENYYPGKVKLDPEGLYIDEGEGKLRRPGSQRGVAPFVGMLGAEAPPVGLSTGLGILGGALGNAPGALGGAFTGGALGQGFNDGMLALAGFHTPSPGEEALRMGTAGGMGMLGEGAGRLVGGVAPTLKEGISHVTENVGPSLARKALLGTAGREELELGQKLTERGYPAPPSMVLKGAPRVQNAVERFRERYNLGAMRSELEPYYEEEAAAVLKSIGVDVKAGEKLLHPTEAVGVEDAGKALQSRAIRELSAADAKLDADITLKRAEAGARAKARVAQKFDVAQSAEQAQAAAQKLVDQGFSNIRQDIDVAFKTAKAGHNGGDLYQLVADKFRTLRMAFGERANYWYSRFGEMTQGHAAPTEGLANEAQAVLQQLPTEFRNANPNIVAKLSRLNGVWNEAGEMVKVPEALSYYDLHELRNLFRGNADWNTLSSDFKNGAWKHFSNQVDRVMHAPDAPPEVRNAMKFLDTVDRWYGYNIKLFDSEMIKAVQKGIQSGEPADPRVLRDILLKEGHTDLTKRVFSEMGPVLANAVRAADVDVMLQNAKSHIPGVIDGRRFFNEVVDRHRNGLLETVHGKDVSAQLLKQAEHLLTLEGKLPVRVQPGDKIGDVIAKARAAKTAADAEAKTDPLKMLNAEMKGIEAERNKRLKDQINNEQLGFLYDPTYGAIKSVETILAKPDTIIAAAGKFGADSAEFNMLRQIYAKKLLQGGLTEESLQKIPESIQRIMFPNASFDSMRLLAKEWGMISKSHAFHGDTASGMMTQSRVENPLGRIASGAAKLLPGSKMVANSVWAGYYEFVTKWTAKNPALFAFMLKGLQGSADEKQAVRNILSKHVQRYGAMGAGAGEGVYQTSGEELSE